MQMTTITRVIVFASYAVLLPVIAGAQSGDRPNIVLLMGDDHGWEETGYNGHEYLNTPVLDEMAASGLRLDRFYAAHFNCSPTRGSVLTGRHPNRYGTFAPNWSMRPEEITIAQLLRASGYRTAHFGKWHVGPVKAESPTSPGAMGFDEWLSHDNFFELNPVLSRNGGPNNSFDGESSAVLVREAIRFIEDAAEAAEPFFVVLWFGSPHEPYSGLPSDLALYDALPDRYSEKSVTLTSNETGEQIRRPLRDVLRERYAEITAMDRAIGELRLHLDNEGIRENTLLWYNGDNGTPASGVAESPLRGLKGQMYEGGIRVPGIIEWPNRIATPRVSEMNAVTSDIFPTLAAIVGQSLPDRPMDGINLEGLIDGGLTSRPRPIFFWSFNTASLIGQELVPYIDVEQQQGTTPLVKLMDGIPTRNFQNVHLPVFDIPDLSGPRVVIDGDHKLVVDAAPNAKTELFNLREDQGEVHNLADRYPDVVDRLQRQLSEWQTSTLNSLAGRDY